MTTYRQCRLQSGNLVTCGWIEERGARLGVTVELPEVGGLWKVTRVTQYAMTEEVLRAKQRRDRDPFPSLVPA